MMLFSKHFTMLQIPANIKRISSMRLAIIFIWWMNRNSPYSGIKYGKRYDNNRANSTCIVNIYIDWYSHSVIDSLRHQQSGSCFKQKERNVGYPHYDWNRMWFLVADEIAYTEIAEDGKSAAWVNEKCCPLIWMRPWHVIWNGRCPTNIS